METGSAAILAFCVVMGVSVPLFGAPLTAMSQTLVDPAKLGRVMALYTTSALLASVLVTGLLPWVMPVVRRLDRAMADR